MEKKKRGRKIKPIIVAIALSLLTFAIICFVGYSAVFAGKIYPKIKVGNLDLGGKTKQEAVHLLNQQEQILAEQGFRFEFNGQVWRYLPKQLDLEYNIEETVDRAFMIGRQGSWFKKIAENVKQIFKTKHIASRANLNKKNFSIVAGKISREINTSGRDAHIYYDEKLGWKVEEEKIGQSANEEEIADIIAAAIINMDEAIQILPVKVKNPIITAKQLKKIKDKLELMSTSGLVLYYKDKKYEINKEAIVSWIEVTVKNGKASPILSADKIKFDIQSIVKEIDREPVDAKLKVSSGRATIFQSAQDGLKLDQEKLILTISEMISGRALASSPKSDGAVMGTNTETGEEKISLAKNVEPKNNINDRIELPVIVASPEINDENIESLGIKELVASASTSFKGSPSNRRHNIQLGASKFNGVLLKPGEEFSALKYLGKIDASTGFLPELVIKESSTIPEYGGGLCQVSTTLFRTALESGFPITERKNHKYRVSYYEPPVGMDATIYDPSPDFKFINDSLAHILIQGYVKGYTITFEFYGTKDGRKIEKSQPQIYDFVSPPPAEYIPDPSLAPGETKRIEREHQGAKANFYYKVTNPDGSIRFEKTFYSKYNPWQARYRIGPTPESAPAPAVDPNISQPQPDPNQPAQSISPLPETETSPAP